MNTSPNLPFFSHLTQPYYPPFAQYFICFISSITASLCITPIITIVDKSVILATNGKMSLTKAITEEVKKVLFEPKGFWKSIQFQQVFLVYFVTYWTSNVTVMTLEGVKCVDVGIVKLITTFVVNTIASMIKDKSMAQRLGNTKKRPFPTISLILFFTRDLLAMFSAFTLPHMISPHIRQFTTFSQHLSFYLAQLISPAITQLLNTFIQLFALDLYNRDNILLKERIVEVRKNYLPSLIVRVCGFTVAYGVGGVVNMEVRRCVEKIGWVG